MPVFVCAIVVVNDDDPVALLLAINIVDDSMGDFESDISDVCEIEVELETKNEF